MKKTLLVAAIVVCGIIGVVGGQYLGKYIASSFKFVQEKEEVRTYAPIDIRPLQKAAMEDTLKEQKKMEKKLETELASPNKSEQKISDMKQYIHVRKQMLTMYELQQKTIKSPEDLKAIEQIRKDMQPFLDRL